jgi:hypothetical protein
MSTSSFRYSLITALSDFDKTSRKLGRVGTGAVKKIISQKQQSKKMQKPQVVLHEVLI